MKTQTTEKNAALTLAKTRAVRFHRDRTITLGTRRVWRLSNADRELIHPDLLPEVLVHLQQLPDSYR